MAKVRIGNQCVLLVVDAQVDVVKGAWEAARAVGKMVVAVERARTQGVPVIWVQHADEDLVQDSPGWQWTPELVPATDELRIHKLYNSAFEQTALEDALAQRGITHIVLVGCATNWCIRATAYAALERGYDLTLVSDAHTTKSMSLEDGTTLDAATLVHDLNTTMTWLAYPGRKNTTVPAQTLNFTDPGRASQRA